MPAISPTRISLAARFICNQLAVAVLIRSWGDDVKVLVRVGSSSGYGPDPLGTWVDGRWRDQSQLLTYWGPKRGDTGCLDALVDPRDHENEIPALMQELIETYLLEQLDPDTADGLRRGLKQHIAKVRLANFVNGDSVDTWSGLLGLASAQNLAAKVAIQAQLSSKECEVLKLLLTDCPLQFGYWGPFKTALKHLDPGLMPREFGVALARLSDPSKTTVCSTEVEDLGWMKAFVDIPSESTRLYMARRMRRELANIGHHDPALYTSISASLLQRWDSELAPLSYLPAYVLGGDQRVLNETGRYVALPIDQSSRRDAHPKSWDSARDLVRKLLPHVGVSVETFTFASQVLLAGGETLPSPKVGQLLLALRSSDRRVSGWGCAIVLRRPSQWKSLSIEHWRKFLNRAETSQLLQVFERQHDPLPKTVLAAADLLAFMDSNRLLLQTDPDRIRAIAEYYIKGITAHSNCANPRALVFVLQSFPSSVCFTEHREILMTQLRKLDSHELMQLYRQLADRTDVPPDLINVLETTLLSLEFYEDEQCQLILNALSMPEPRAINLGWKLLDGCERTEEILDVIWLWLKRNEAPESVSPQSWQERRIEILTELLARRKDVTATVIDLLGSNEWRLSSSQLTRLLLQSPPCLRAIWHSVASDEEEVSAALRALFDQQSGMTLAVGDVLQADDLTVVNTWQQRLLLRYVRESNRVNSDLAFAVAAVALGDFALQRECLEQLKHSNALEKCWLRLAELGLPEPLATIQLYLNGLEHASAFTNAVLACVDSIVPMVRDLGLEMIATNTERIDHDRLWPALSQSDDPVVQARVAKESLIRSWPDGDGLAAFDRRLLISRRTNRRAKNQVQNRLTRDQLLAPARRAALLDLARGANGQDREWALRHIAELTLSGVPFDGVAVRTVTTAGNPGGMR